jgi:hypothetical protein
MTPAYWARPRRTATCIPSASLGRLSFKACPRWIFWRAYFTNDTIKRELATPLLMLLSRIWRFCDPPFTRKGWQEWRGRQFSGISVGWVRCDKGRPSKHLKRLPGTLSHLTLPLVKTSCTATASMTH